MNIEITGLDEIEGKLLRLGGKALLDREVARSARKAMRPVLDDAKAHVPVDDGDLKRSLIISSRKLKNGNRSVRVGPDTKTIVRADESGTLDFSKKKRPANYAHLVELGTVHSAAKPFLRPAFDRHSPGAIEIFKEEMMRGLVRAIGRIGG